MKTAGSKIDFFAAPFLVQKIVDVETYLVILKGAEDETG